MARMTKDEAALAAALAALDAGTPEDAQRAGSGTPRLTRDELAALAASGRVYVWRLDAVTNENSRQPKLELAVMDAITGEDAAHGTTRSAVLLRQFGTRDELGRGIMAATLIATGDHGFKFGRATWQSDAHKRAAAKTFAAAMAAHAAA